MNGAETLGLVGDMLALVGLASGLPLLLVGWVWRSLDGPHVATEIIIVPGEDGPTARWYADADFHERALRPGELHETQGQDEHTGFVSRRDPARMRLEAHHRPATLCLALGGALAGVGAAGLVASLIPVFLD